MLLPDDLIIKNNCSKSMIKIHKKYNSSVMASMNVNKKTVSRWGIYNLDKKVDCEDIIMGPKISAGVVSRKFLKNKKTKTVGSNYNI